MKVAIIYNKDFSHVINTFGMQNKEVYNEKTVHNIAKALEGNGHNVEVIDGNMNVIESLKGFMPKVLEGEKMGIVFNLAYGIQGESRYTHIPAMLEMLGIPYVGSNPSGHALALDKVITKVILQKNDIPTPNFWVYSNHEEDMSDVEYPVIIKPKMEAVSFGLRVVNNIDDLKDAVKFIIEEFQQQALVEQFIRGREFAVGIIGNNPPEAFPVLEIDLENDPDAIQSVEDKKHKPREKICPAKISEKLAVKMQEESIKAFKSLQLHDFARVDIRLDENGNFYILEINSMASLGLSGSYPFAAKATGLTYNALVNKMLDVACLRYFGDQYSAESHGKITIDSTYLKIKSFLRSRQAKYLSMLETLVNINTYVRNSEGVNTSLKLIRKQLVDLGFSCTVHKQSELGNTHFYTNSEDDKIDVLLLGSIDVAVKIENHRYYQEQNDKLFGTGIWQNKGGLITLIGALQALKSIKKLKKRKIGILLLSDDTIKNIATASLIKQKSSQAKFVIGLSGAFLDGGIVTSRSGATTYDIALNLINNDNEKTVIEFTSIFTKLTNSLIKMSAPDEGLLVAPTILKMNSNIQRISANGKMSVSIRYNHLEQIKIIEKKIMELVPAKYKKMIDFYVRVGKKRPALERTENIDKFWKKIKSIANSLDIRLREEHRWSSSSICFAQNARFMIDGIGPVGIKDENEREYILKYSLIERAALLTVMLDKLEKGLDGN